MVQHYQFSNLGLKYGPLITADFVKDLGFIKVCLNL